MHPVLFTILLVFGTFVPLSFFIRGWSIYRPLDLSPTRNRGRRFLPVLAATFPVRPLVRKSCAQCHFFEPTGMSELVKRSPAAAEAARWLTPDQMAAAEQVAKDGWTEKAGFDQEGQFTSLGGPRWEELGVCHKRPGVMTFPANTCEEWR